MITQTLIYPGRAICSIDRTIRCRVGAILQDSNNDLIILTAKHRLSRFSDDVVIDEETGVQIGTHVYFGLTDGSDAPDFSESIGAVRIEKDMRGHVAVDRVPKELIVNAFATIGMWTLVQLEELSDFGEITAVGGGVFLEDPVSGDVRSYRDPIIVDVKSLDPAIDRNGAGSLLVDSQRRALGILIGHDAEFSYAASVGTFAATHNLRCLSSRSTSSLSPTNSRELVSSLRDVREDAWAMTHDLQAAESFHDDPKGLNVPSHLLEKLAG